MCNAVGSRATNQRTENQELTAKIRRIRGDHEIASEKPNRCQKKRVSKVSHRHLARIASLGHSLSPAKACSPTSCSISHSTARWCRALPHRTPAPPKMPQPATLPCSSLSGLVCDTGRNRLPTCSWVARALRKASFVPRSPPHCLPLGSRTCCPPRYIASPTTIPTCTPTLHRRILARRVYVAVPATPPTALFPRVTSSCTPRAQRRASLRDWLAS